MNKEEALEFLKLNDNDLTIEAIEERVDDLRKLYDPKYVPNESMDIIKHHSDETKYNAILEAADYLKKLVNQREQLKKELEEKNNNEEIKSQPIAEPENVEVLTAPENENKEEEIPLEPINQESMKEEKISVVEDIQKEEVKDQGNQELNIGEFLSSENNGLDDLKLDEITPVSNETNMVTPDVMDEAINYAERDIPSETLEPINQESAGVEATQEAIPTEEQNTEEKIVEQEPVSEELKDIFEKVNADLKTNVVVEGLNSFKAKGIQVTKSFVNYLRSDGFKCKLQQSKTIKVIKSPYIFVKSVGEKLTSVSNQTQIIANLDKLSHDELKKLSDKYAENDNIFNDYDNITRKTIVNYIRKFQQDIAIDLNDSLENEKNEVEDANYRITALHNMSDALTENEPQKIVYDDKIKEQYKGMAAKIKDIRSKEAVLDTTKVEQEDKGNFFENIINKLNFGHKEKFNENSLEYQTYIEHKKALAKLEELENKAIMVNSDVKALESYMAIEELKTKIKEDEEKIFGHGKSL